MKQTILLTGSSKGIGKAILEELQATNNYRIFALSRTEQSNTQNTFFYTCDLSSGPDLEKVLKTIAQDSQGIDIIINNAGIGNFKNVEDFSSEEWDTLMNINLKAPFIVIKHFLPGMKQKNYGKIISITSDADTLSFAQGSLYCASKAALKAFIASIRKEVQGYHIALTTIAPGRVDTNFNKKTPGDRPNSLKPKDVANQVMHVLNQSERCEIETIYLNSILEKELH